MKNRLEAVHFGGNWSTLAPISRIIGNDGVVLQTPYGAHVVSAIHHADILTLF